MKNEKYWTVLALLSAVSMILTGCLYPSSERRENQIPVETYVQEVQQALDQYQKDKGVLPIRNQENETPVYRKYAIDFSRLLPYLSRIPANAFEEGGIHLYVIVDPETNPVVRLYDVGVSSGIQDLQKKVRIYRSETGGYPLGDKITGPFYLVDFTRLETNELVVRSPLSGSVLPIIIDASTGEVGIDYSIDLGLIIQNMKISEWEEDRDLRQLIPANSMFVPAHSFPYQWDQGKPRLTKKNLKL